MQINKMTKEELELLSNKDITNLLLEEKGCQNTADLFRKIIELLELPSSTFDKKIADYFTALSTDKRFVLLEDGTWDLKNRHAIDKRMKKIALDDDEDETDEEIEVEEDDTVNFDIDETDNYDDSDDDLKDLVVLDEDELELEE